MIKITEVQERTYKAILKQPKSTKEVRELLGAPTKTIEHHLRRFAEIGLAERIEGYPIRYKGVAKVEYTIIVSYRKPNFSTHLEAKDTNPPIELQCTLSEDDERWLYRNQKEKRSFLAKELGVPKVQFNLLFEKLKNKWTKGVPA